MALLSYGLYLVLGLLSPPVNGTADFTLDDAIWVLGQVLFAIVGAVIAWRRPKLPIGWLFCTAGLLGVVGGIAARAAVHALAAGHWSSAGGAAAWLSAALWYPNIALLVLGSLLFPSGRPPSRAWWAVAWLLGAGAAVATVAMVLLWPARGLELLDSTPRSPSAPLGTAIMNTAALMLAAGAVATVVALLVRLKRSRGVERQQVKWLTYAGALAVVGLLLLLPGDVGLGSPSASLDLAGTVLTAGAGLGIPVAVGLAILRYRLFDIDLLIARTVVYGLLSAGFTGIYLAIVVGVGTLVGSVEQPNVLLTVVATGVIAVAFQPARDRSRRLANRLVYGSRATPYEVLSTFSRDMASASSDDSLQRLARLVVEATSAVQASVWLRFGDVLEPQVSWPEGGGELTEPVPLGSGGVSEALAVEQPRSLTFPVEQDEELLGALTVTVSPVEPLSPASQKLIRDLATQTGLGLRFQRMKERALFARALASFLPPEVADLVEASPSALSLQEELEATIVFSDIRGFASLAERLAPREVAEMVGRHLAAMAEVVTTHGGVVDKFTGDAVMAVFGAPRPAHDHARRALMCAADMQRRQLALNEAPDAGFPTSQIGIGINTGMVIAGTVGGPGRLNYTVLGDAVNVAQRLESQAKAGEILAAAVTVLQAGADRAEPIGPLQIKGRKDPVDTYRITWADNSATP
jgi:class 3 adenylate cyclase